MFRFLIPLAFVILVLAGCGSTSSGLQSGSEEAGGATDNVSLEDIELQLEVEQVDKEVLFKAIISNTAETPVELTFPSGQMIEIKVTDDNDEIIYTYSMDKLFIQSVTTEVLKAGESITINDEWVTDKVTAGEYKAKLELLVNKINGKKTVGKASEESFTINPQNVAFRSVKVSGNDGEYKVTGQARVFEASFFYAVEDGHDYVIEETVFQTKEGAPSWSEFEIPLRIAKEKIPENGVLTLELYERSAKDGSIENMIYIALE